MTQQKHIIAIDLDGTLLRNDHLPSAFTIDTLRKVHEQGHTVIITTGRTYSSSQHIYDLLNIPTPMINSNGAYCHFPNHPDWSGTQVKSISLELAQQIFELTQTQDLGYLAMETLKDIYITSFEALKSPYFASYAKNPTFLHSPSELKEQPIAFYWLSTPAQQPYIQQLIAETIETPLEVCTWGGEHPSLDITPKGVHKAFGIQHVAQHLDLAHAPVIAFGDSDNDVPMIDFATIGVAMANGNENAKSVANVILDLSNEEDGVAHFLKNYFSID
ncbi:HAD family phosphatase [Carnobacteriaceae bacterium zg-ZUI252]|nr:HAD family phosphatase [Carnobacteriaceae bacterium zg-ZUI252]MBS4769594.1 HAD family phosphatase [Carnobacteriaceae bacterium zg-ZUI240]QTU83057.1 HAD family phosphatase [Carnobacteriaceae bacterium zg-C25]